MLTSLELLDERKGGVEGENALRQSALNLVKQGDGKILDVQAMRLEIGTASTIDTIVENIYPTEYEPPETIPAGSTLDKPDEELSPHDRQLKVARMFACPTAFDTRNTGRTLEAEVNLVKAEDRLFDVALAYEEVIRVGDATWVEGTITMPIFSTKSWRDFVRLSEGGWSLYSAQPETEKDGSRKGDDIRWCFVKVERVRLMRRIILLIEIGPRGGRVAFPLSRSPALVLSLRRALTVWLTEAYNT